MHFMYKIHVVGNMLGIRSTVGRQNSDTFDLDREYSVDRLNQWNQYIVKTFLFYFPISTVKSIPFHVRIAIRIIVVVIHAEYVNV